MGMIEEAFENFQMRYPLTELSEKISWNACRMVNAQKKTFAYLIVKEKLFSNMVDIPAELFFKARRAKEPIFLCVGRTKFYQFDTGTIMTAKPYLSTYKDVDSINFPITLGKSLQPKLHKQSTPTSVPMNEAEMTHPVMQTMVKELSIEKLSDEEQRQIEEESRRVMEVAQTFS